MSGNDNQQAGNSVNNANANEGNNIAQPQQQIFVSVNLPIPPQLDLEGDLSTNWKDFKAVWHNYEIASRIAKQPKSENLYSINDDYPKRIFAMLELIDNPNDRLIVPESCREDITKTLHASHLGVQAMLRNAREAVYWPRMCKELTEYSSRCGTCQRV
ncbi:hypothetical protein LOTGIDRAFT_172216 [Lottia gigantea]|uniref:Integrase zinc-binding domain-containing protein n=1 Tax=Lottia gigantea TaxID=225164 RepID=V4CJI3_LOTGI|nr:hypothetical protein LOTGIDRAFT_172216 [Lottia gigantea]ESP02335.1 hypothetical protein LOTGIDRAFT_172216 [Lottia gigantea]